MKIALVGYGKMGKAVETIALRHEHEIVCRLGRDAASADPALLRKADVAIEFSNAASAAKNILQCFDAGIPVVSGTTGWNEQLESVGKVAQEKKAAFFYASNFSIGVNIFFELNAALAQMMNTQKQYHDIRIHEVHHVHKTDSPSGTAISLADQIIQRIERIHSWKNFNGGDASVPLHHPKNILPVLSLREDDVPGTHRVTYVSSQDSLEMIHTAFNREGFAEGALAAAQFIIGKHGIFGMRDLLRF